MKIELGDRVQDKITGFCGIAMASDSWWQGCKRWCIKPEKLYEGKPINGHWFDEATVQLIEKQPNVLPMGSGDDKADPGGPRSNPGLHG